MSIFLNVHILQGCGVTDAVIIGVSRLQLKCDGTRHVGGEVKGKLANGVGSQYPSHHFR